MDSVTQRYPNLPQRLIGLEALSSNLWWSWHPAARMVFKMLDRPAWKESGHNPVRMLGEISREILESAAADPEYLRLYDDVVNQFQQDTLGNGDFFSRIRPDVPSPVVVYFSAEYGLHHSLPFYAGGLGFLAGDFIKECSDLGIPLEAVGFMYPEGYVRQRITEAGRQESLDEPLDREAASISRVLTATGEQLIIQVPFIDPPIYVALWKVAVGRCSLYLMDTDIEKNEPWNRLISARLYVGDQEQRLRQEIVLGIGGYELLGALGIGRDIIHLNEGHPAFALLEKVREQVESGIPYEDAVEQVRRTSVFTTHTPLAAGTDVFPFALVEKYFHRYWPSLGIDHDTFVKLGIDPRSPRAGFNMTVLAFRLSGFSNGVSQRHTEVAKGIWQGLWPALPVEKVPIDSVTNGVHVATWIEPKIELLFKKHIGSGWLSSCDDPKAWEKVDAVPDDELWATHYWLKVKLVNVIREALRLRWAKEHAGPTLVVAGGAFLDPAALTICFARRFASYKRADLIFHDMDRLKRLVTSRWRPVQIIFAGKAHPADEEGKMILERVFTEAKNTELGGRIAFIEDYGEQFAQYLVHGVDVWLNNPLPPMEASGTSGMKAAMNGVPQLSIMDGWWIEGFTGKNGWAFTHRESGNDSNGVDADSIYTLLEKEIVPLYYRISDDGIPHGWISVMRESIKNAPKFSSRRMVKEYARKFYVPAWDAAAKK